MKKMLKKLIDMRKTDYSAKTIATSAISIVIGLAFTLYNGFLGVYYSSIWNGTICVYYILLAVVRGVVVNAQRKINGGKNCGEKYIKRIYCSTHIILFAINIALIVPIAVMIKGNREYNLGIIPAIAMATYTTYRVTMAVINLKKSRKSKSLFIRELININFIDALVSVLLLQNTLIIANEGKMTEEMSTLSIVSSTAIWIAIAVITAMSFARAERAENPR